MDIVEEAIEGDVESQQFSVQGDEESRQPVMDILEAAEVGDVSFLRKACEENVGDLESYFLGHSYFNILHKAVLSGQYSFLCEALEILKSHPTLIIHLICQTNDYGENSLHAAVYKGNIYVVKLLVHAYVTAVASADNFQETLMPPWLWLSRFGQTPLYCCFVNTRQNEGIAMYLVLQDQRLGRDRYPPKHECSTLILDGLERSVVYNAMKAGWSLLVEHILTSDLPYKLDGLFNETPLHYASKCNAEVSKLLLEKHPELINVPSNESVLHAAVEDGATWLVKLMLVGDETPVRTWIKACRRLMWHKNNRGETPLHISARLGSTEIAELIIQAYYSTLQDEATTWDADVEARPEIPHMGVDLLFMKNNDGEAPLRVALRNKHDDCGVMLTKQTIPFCQFGFVDVHWDALLDAVNTGCRQSIKTIIALVFAPGSFYVLDFTYLSGILTPAVQNIFKYLADKYYVVGLPPGYHKMSESEELEKLSKVLPELVKKPVKDGKTILTEAAERGEDWLVTLCLESDKDLLMESAPAWQAACENGCVSTLITFISKFGDQEFIKHCRSIKQTPLHHIKLKQNGEYLELLKNYPILEGMKNEIDTDDYTPLHRAIQRDNLELAKALLQTKGIEVSIEGNKGTKALILLEDHRKDSDTWHELYIELLKNPRFEELKNQTDCDEATPLHRAIQRDDLELTKTLLEIKGINVSIKNKDGMTPSDLLEDLCKFDGKWHELYIELFKNPRFKELINQTDSDEATPLHRAIQLDDLELTKTLLEINGINVTIKNKDGMTPSDLLEKRCKFDGKWNELYIIELVKNPGFKELINQTDSDGATPLHRAIQREDLKLTKTLLEIKGINVTIKNKNGKTASDLLEDRCKSARKWGKMCRAIEQDETVENLKFVFRSIAFEEMPNTLSVVAALVATITFAAGITVPGGVDGSTGEAVLSTRAAFLVFSVSNTTAMCSSIMVLFLLLGPMMWDPQPSLFYVKLSLYLLLFSLGGTMFAFMTGVYATMITKVKWNAIFIVVSCSLTLFVACVILLSTYSRRFKNLLPHRIIHIRQKTQPSSPLLPVSTDIATTSTIQSQPGSANRIVSPVSGSLGQVPPQFCKGQTQNTEVGQFSRTSPEAAVNVESKFNLPEPTA